MEAIEETLKNKKRNIYILVEGTSDLAFLNLYICKNYGFTFKNTLDIKKLDNKMYGASYEKTGVELRIYSVGGCSRFNHGYNIIKKLFNENTSHLITIIDSDEKTKEEIEKELHYDDIEMKCNEFVEYKNTDGFYDLNFKSYVRVVPANKTGALETVLMEAIALNDDAIVKCSCDFIDNLNDEETKYISSNRLKLKAKTSVIFSLISPDSTFESLTSKFELIDLDAKSIKEAFGFLDEVLI